MVLFFCHRLVHVMTCHGEVRVLGEKWENQGFPGKVTIQKAKQQTNKQTNKESDDKTLTIRARIRRPRFPLCLSVSDTDVLFLELLPPCMRF